MLTANKNQVKDYSFIQILALNTLAKNSLIQFKNLTWHTPLVIREVHDNACIESTITS